MPPLGMISCGALQICNFRRRNPSSATNVSNITGGSEKCVGLARVILRPPLRAREVSRPTEQHDPHFLHKPDTFPFGTNRLPERWCSLQAASDEAYWKRVQTSTTTYRGHVTTPCQLPRIFGIVWFSEDLNGSIRQAAEVISPPGVGPAPPSSALGLRMSQRHHIGFSMPLLGMISCGALQICNFRRRNPSSATNVSNIT
jgi:hypothetical protein